MGKIYKVLGFITLLLLIGITVDGRPSRRKMLRQIPLERKIAAMLLVGFEGTGPELTPTMKELVNEIGVGGLIVFEKNGARIKNIASQEQITALAHNLQAEAARPILLAVDQEGGRVVRLKTKYGYLPTVSASYLGQCANDDTTRLYAARLADQVASTGLNMNCAPCLDLNVNPTCPVIGALGRSFSADPDSVAHHAAIFYDEQRQRGVISVYKHFPGHGSSTVDSHYGFTDITQTWHKNELKPYRILIKAHKCDVIMTSHVFNSHFDRDYPATLSRRVITRMLRRGLGFRGVVVTDDLCMKAIAERWTLPEAAALAVRAGVDLLTIGHGSNEDYHRVIDEIARQVRSGAIRRAQIDRAYCRILQLMELL